MRVIAIDGPVGSGKSSVAKALGERLGLPVLESGAMYRALTAVALSVGLSPGPESADALVRLANVVDMDSLDPASLRTASVNQAVSEVASQADVRAALVARQRSWVEARGGAIVEGRDIGTVVFPDAELKVFLTASVEERARRRGADEDPENLARRDHLDSTRAASPLVAADDAVVIDTTDRSIEQIVDEIVEHL